MEFHTTRWSLIDAAQRGDRSALETLLARYRAPVVGYLRRCGWRASDAEDLTQDVFVHLYQHVLPAAEAQRGRFRSLVLTATRNLALSRLRALQAQKRGGGRVHVPLEEELDIKLEPETVFDREWLGHLLERALDRLQREHPNYHAALAHTLLDELSYAEVAERLGTTVTNVRNHVHRGKKKVVSYLQGEVEQYAGSPKEHETEMTLLRGLFEGEAS